MKKINSILTLVLGLGIFPVFAQNTFQLANQVESDLSKTLDRLLQKEEYTLSVQTKYKTIVERQAAETEQISVGPDGTQGAPVMALPGFNPVPSEVTKPSVQSRQSFKNVEKEILQSIHVDLTLHKGLAEERATEARRLVEKYLQARFDKIYSLNTERVEMRVPGLFARVGMFFANNAWIWALLGLGLLGWFMSRMPRTNSAQTNENLQPFSSYRRMSIPSYPDFSNTKDVGNSERGSLALGEASSAATLPLLEKHPNGKTPDSEFSRIPLNGVFADARNEVLTLVLGNAKIFRSYFKKLQDSSRAELYAALRGPAFDSFLDSLQLEYPKVPESTLPPSDEKLAFYKKNFNEYIQTYEWQNQQFFGFLNFLTLDQIIALVRGSNPFVAALMLRQIKPELIASVLKTLNAEQKHEIVSNSSRLNEVSTQELQAIESQVRLEVEKLPQFSNHSSFRIEELSYWNKVLAHSEDQEDLLIELQKSRPDLYEKLAKYRFKLEDLPSLPSTILQRVMEEFDNEELARALVSVSLPVKDYALNELAPERQALINSLMELYARQNSDNGKAAAHKLTAKLRESLA